MNSFKENIFYKKAKGMRPRKFILLFILFLIIIIGHLVFTYLSFIPKTINHYEKFPLVQEHIRIPLKSIASLSIIWSILLIGFIGGMINYTWYIQKLIDRIDNYLKQKKVLPKKEFKEHFFYKKAKKLKPRGYIFSFIMFLICTICQLILIYLFFIPKTLIPYEKVPSVQGHIKIALESIACFSIFWQIMFLTFNVIMIYYVKNTNKLADSFENYRKV